MERGRREKRGEDLKEKGGKAWREVWMDGVMRRRQKRYVTNVILLGIIMPYGFYFPILPW